MNSGPGSSTPTAIAAARRDGVGVLRPRPDNEFEALFIHPTGYTEVWHGKVTVSEIQDATITRASLEMTTDSVMRTASARRSTSAASGCTASRPMAISRGPSTAAVGNQAGATIWQPS